MNTKSSSSTNTPSDAVGAKPDIKPEWLRLPEAVRIFGISRAALYVLISEQKIRSTCLRKPGSVKGIRLINYGSLAEYVNKAADAGGIAA